MKYKRALLFLFILISIFSCRHSNSSTKSVGDDETTKEKLIWDFNSENTYVYSFEQQTNSINNWGGFIEHIDTSESIARGELKVKSKGNDKADFVLVLRIEDDAFKQEIPPRTIVVPDMDAHGQMDAKRRNADVMFDLLFPLPSKDLEIGESEQLEMQLPFNLMGSPLYVKGYNRLEYIKDTAPNTALISSEFKIDNLDVPEEIEGEFVCSFSGKAEFEFNYKEHYFAASTIDLHVRMSSDFVSEEAVRETMNMDVESRSRYAIQLLGVE